MTQKIVIKVWMDGKRCQHKALRVVIYILKLVLPYDIIWKRCTCPDKLRKKAMKIAVASPGVASVAFEGEEKNKLVVAGESIDAVQLIQSLRRNVAFAEVLSLTPREDDKKKKER